jgi:hypothetical protein
VRTTSLKARGLPTARISTRKHVRYMRAA